MLESDTLITKDIKLTIKNGIVYTEFISGTELTLEVAKRVVQDRLRFTKEMEFKAVVDITNLKRMDPKAMKFMASEEAYKGVMKLAIFSNSLLSKIFANFWLKIDKPYRPTKFFTNKTSAYLYLEEEVNLN